MRKISGKREGSAFGKGGQILRKRDFLSQVDGQPPLFEAIIEELSVGKVVGKVEAVAGKTSIEKDPQDAQSQGSVVTIACLYLFETEEGALHFDNQIFRGDEEVGNPIDGFEAPFQLSPEKKAQFFLQADVGLRLSTVATRGVA